MLIFLNEMEVELSKLKEKWDEGFNNKSYFSKDNMQTWTMDYVNLNNNTFIVGGEAHDDLIEVEPKLFEMNIKQGIMVPPYGISFIIG